jgi:anti-sigma factor RsiW
MINNTDCNKLDAYLADDLSADAALRFESHLQECDACRETIDEQNWIDGLLQSPARIQIEHTPTRVLDSLRPSAAQRDRRKLQAAYGFAAAAVLLIGLGWFTLRRHGMPPKASVTQDVAVVHAAHVPAREQPQATFVASTDAIAVSLESPSTDVTIVQVYPTTDTERRWRLEQSLLSATTEPNGG